MKSENRILIRGVLLNGKPSDILIEGNRIARITRKIEVQAEV